ncbi:MAG: sigma-70 family RNA polymerase sigma factor [Gemmataceae bacterium]
MPVVDRRLLLFHFCRLQRPGIHLPWADFHRHLDRTLALYQSKEPGITEPVYLDQLYALDWYVAVACLENDRAAWEALFAARTGRADCLLVDALRARAGRLYPRDDEKQDSAVTEFWSQLLASEHGLPILARYDGQRPLVPWLIRVFQNAHISRLRSETTLRPLPDDDLAQPLPEKPAEQTRWHEAFVQAARQSLAELSDTDVLILGLRLRYRMSQREVANLLHVHEGTISRQTDRLRDRCLDFIRDRLAAQGWSGDELESLVLTEMGAVLLDEPRLAADQLAMLLAAKGSELPSKSLGSTQEE